jgi:hypothetical protein
MKVVSIEQLSPVWEHRIWENGYGRYVGSGRFRIETDEPIFASVAEERGNRVSRKGTPLYEALDTQFVGRVGGHSFEITDVKSETECTVAFRIGYVDHKPDGSDCESCPDKDGCPGYNG